MEQLPSSIPENTADYYDEDGLLYCGRCHTPKEAFFAKGVALMGKNKHPIECSCQRIERAKQEALISQQKHSDLVRRPKAEGFSDPAMLDWKFENDNGRSPQMCHAHRYVEQWQTMRAENLGLFLWGGVGTGKSFLAGCIANALMEQEVSMHMTNFAEVHRLLGTAFQYAVEWGILVKSPVPVDSPKKSTQERIIWTVEEMRAALDSMEDLILHLAVHLTLVGALREGEIVGLTPEDLDFDAADGIGTFRINKSMQRVRKEALKQVDDGCIIKVFPDKLERSTTSLILKSTKTASSCRTIFMTSALKEELKKWLNQLAADERKDPARCHDSGMLFRLPNGLAVEPVLIRKKFLKWQDAHPEFPRIVFHGLRHPYVKHTTKNKSLQKQKSQTIKQADSLGFALLLLLILKGAGCVELKKHFSFSISPYE